MPACYNMQAYFISGIIIEKFQSQLDYSEI